MASTSPTRTGEVLTAMQLAYQCQCNAGTVHLWAQKQGLQHYRTRGGHYRFKRIDVLSFLSKNALPIPAALKDENSYIAILEPTDEVLLPIIEGLRGSFRVRGYQDLFRLLIAMGEHPPRALVLTTLDLGRLQLLEITRHIERIRHVKKVVFCQTPHGFESTKEDVLQHAHAFVDDGNIVSLEETLLSLLDAV